MFKVREVVFVESHGGWAVAFEPAPADATLKVGQVLVQGMRRWTVVEVHDAPKGLVAGRIAGEHPLSRELILRDVTEPMSDQEFVAHVVLLVRMARGLRHLDVDGIVDRVQRMNGQDRQDGGNAIAKTALLMKHVVDNGATTDQLSAVAHALGIGDEL